MGNARRLEQLPGREDGITLIEVMIALFILSVSLVALASAAIPSLAALRDARERELATNAASSAIEDVRSRSFRDIVMAAGTDLTTLPAAAQAAFAVSGPSCADDEPLATDTAAADPVPLTGERAGTEVHTIVTWADADCSGIGRTMKRITTVALWAQGQRTGSVVESTVVAPAGRGLPVPDFALTPDTDTLVWTPAQVTAGHEQCAEHTLRNLGAEDRYEFAVVDATDAPILTTPLLLNTEFSLAAGDWLVRGFLESPAVTEARNGSLPPPAAVDEDGSSYPTLMTDAVTASTSRPGSDLQVGPGGSATLTFCYRPGVVDAVPGTFRLGLFSRFDERRVEAVEHTLAVQDAATVFYLQDNLDTEAHPRGVLTSNNKVAYPPSVMGPLNAETDDRVQNLGTLLFDWSTDVGDVPVAGPEVIGTPSLPGTRLRRALLGSGNTAEPDGLRLLDWRYQFVEPTELLPNAELVIWVAPVDAIDDGVLSAPQTVALEITLDGLNVQEQTGTNQLAWGGVSVTTSYIHTVAGWQGLAVPIPFATGHAFEADQRLRLRVACAAASSEDCNLAYDVAASHEARLEVRLQ